MYFIIKIYLEAYNVFNLFYIFKYFLYVKFDFKIFFLYIYFLNTLKKYNIFIITYLKTAFVPKKKIKHVFQQGQREKKNQNKTIVAFQTIFFIISFPTFNDVSQ